MNYAIYKLWCGSTHIFAHYVKWSTGTEHFNTQLNLWKMWKKKIHFIKRSNDICHKTVKSQCSMQILTLIQAFWYCLVQWQKSEEHRMVKKPNWNFTQHCENILHKKLNLTSRIQFSGSRRVIYNLYKKFENRIEMCHFKCFVLRNWRLNNSREFLFSANESEGNCFRFQTFSISWRFW